MEKIQWHPIFAAAFKLELREYKDMLDIKEEYQLNVEPLRIDVLVIKKLNDKKILINIAEIFEKHNIVEYKSPSDYLSIDDYYKVKSYAYIYITQEKKIKIKEITLTMVSNHYPRELIEYFKKERGFEIKNHSEGIYYIKGDDVKLQIIIADKLPPKINRYIRILINKLKEKEEADAMINTLEEYEKNTKDVEMGIIVKYIEDKHLVKIMEAIEMSQLKVKEEMMKYYEMYLERKGLKDEYRAAAIQEGMERGIERGKLETAKKMIKAGYDVEKIISITGLSVEMIQDLRIEK